MSDKPRTTAQAWRAHLEICPITSGLETKLTRPTYEMICKMFQKSAKAKEMANSGDPYSIWCQKCKGKIIPKGLTFIEVDNGQI